MLVIKIKWLVNAIKKNIDLYLKKIKNCDFIKIISSSILYIFNKTIARLNFYIFLHYFIFIEYETFLIIPIKTYFENSELFYNIYVILIFDKKRIIASFDKFYKFQNILNFSRLKVSCDSTIKKFTYESFYFIDFKYYFSSYLRFIRIQIRTRDF